MEMKRKEKRGIRGGNGRGGGGKEAPIHISGYATGNRLAQAKQW